MITAQYHPLSAMGFARTETSAESAVLTGSIAGCAFALFSSLMGVTLPVQGAMVELGFRPNHAARQLAVRGPNRPRVVALMPFFSANFYFSVSRPMSNGLASSKIDLLVYDIQNRDNKNRLTKYRASLYREFHQFYARLP